VLASKLGVCFEGALLPLSVTTVGMLSLIPGLIVTGVMEDDYYLLAGFLSYSVRSLPPLTARGVCAFWCAFACAVACGDLTLSLGDVQSGCAVMAQVLQVIDSAAVTLILCFAEKPEILEAKYPLLYARFRSLCDPPPPPDHPDNTHQPLEP
jgi:hypothetical protein